MIGTTETINIWIIDDEPGMYLGAKKALNNNTVEYENLETKAIYDVSTYDTGKKLLEALENDTPDLILLDNKLPGISGLEILEKLKKNKIDLVAIMITAYGTFEQAVTATKAGAFDFLAKPFTPDELRYNVKKAVEHIILTKRAKQLDSEKKKIRFEFIGVLAHELKSPLNALDGFFPILKQAQLGDDIGNYQQIITRMEYRTQGMRKLIMDLLDLTRIESGEKLRTVEMISLKKSIETVLENFEHEAQKKGITVKACLDDIHIEGDHAELEMLIGNFVSNGIKYNKNNGTLYVSLFQNGEHICIEVKDTGIGMNEEEQKLLFKEFSRIKNNKTRSIAGSGLGLSIVKKIINLYKGEIKVESEAEVGSTFTILLPENGNN